MDRCMKDERTLADRLEAHAQRYERSALMAENRAARRTEGYKAANERGMARLYLSRAADLHEAAQALRSQPSVEEVAKVLAPWGPPEPGRGPVTMRQWNDAMEHARQITALYKGEGDDRP